MKLCWIGEKIAKQCNDVMVLSNGECTRLYYHIQNCDHCEELRLLEIEKNFRLK